MNGYIRIHRKLLEWEWYTDVNTKCLFIHLLIKANFKEKNWRGQVIKRGQMITSVNSLSAETGLSISQIRTSLSKLESSKEIDIQTTNVNTCITVNYYDNYQNDSKQIDKPDSKPVSKPFDKPVSNNLKKEKNKKDNNKGGFKYEFTCFESKERFLKFFNDAKKYYTKSTRETKLLSKTDLNNLKQLNTAYSAEDFRKAISAMSKSEWVRQTKNFNPAHFLRVDNFNKYLNAEKTITKAAYTDSNV